MTPEQEDLLRGLAVCDETALDDLLDATLVGDEPSGLDPRVLALVRLAGVVAVDSDPASYQWSVAQAIAAGASDQDIVGVLVALAPIVGRVRVCSAAPEVSLAIGLDLRPPGPG
jgi:alkylhydroperoxidase/carboxymuconolactone decarboxylase family protein YurZ